MNAAIANVAYPLIQHTLSLRDRLENGEFLDVDFEQSILKELLDANNEPADAADDEDLPPDWAVESGTVASLTRPLTRPGSPYPFLSFRYALVCWLDEMFGRYSNWLPGSWRDQPLELAVYGSRDGAWKFWDQARLAEQRSEREALRIFYLCVMLGFRGELAQAMDEVHIWVERVRGRMASTAAIKHHEPPELEPVTNVAPLRARERLQRLVMTAGTFFLVLVPVAAYLLVRRLGH